MGRNDEEYLITGGMECKPGKIHKVVVEKLEQLLDMYEKGKITKSTLIVMIDEFYGVRSVAVSAHLPVEQKVRVRLPSDTLEN